MRAFVVLLLLAACTAVSEPPRTAPPGLAVRYLAAPTSPAVRPPRTLAVLAWHGAAPGGTAVDALAAAVRADRGTPFRAADAGVIGIRITAGEPEIGLDATRATAIVGDDLTTVIAPTGAAFPAVHLRRFGDGDELQIELHPTALDHSGGTAVDLGAVAPAPDGSLSVHRDARGDTPGFVLVLRVGGEATAAAVLAARAEVAVTGSTLRAHAAAVSWPDRLPGLAVGEGPRRGAVLACAARHDLGRLVDIALVADEPLLVAIADALPAGPDDAFAIERAALMALLPAVQRGQVDRAMTAAMRRHFGALADDAATIEFLLEAAGDAAAFAAALHAANVEALDDRSADRRLAATTWLEARGVDLTGYDPFGTRDVRRPFVHRLLAAGAR